MTLSLFALLLLAAPDAGTAAPPCTAAEHRQFDFWRGSWKVTTPDGKAAGENTITRELNGCVLHEHWVGAGGNAGESFNIYDATTKKWHQTWVDGQGSLLVLDGAFADGKMVLLSAPSSKPLHRITWSQVGKQVRQLWETSSDGGKTWAIAFDGLYTRI